MIWLYLMAGLLVLFVSNNTNYRATGTWLSVTGLVMCLFGIGFFRVSAPNQSFLPFFAIGTSAIASGCDGVKRGIFFIVAILFYLRIWGITT
jgi:hypothetical protein